MKRIAQAVLALLIGAFTSSGSAAVIGFDEMTGATNDPFYLYTEDGFAVFPGGGADWVKYMGYGKPAPSVVFNRRQNEGETWAGMFIREEFAHPFNFFSIDLYSSITRIPFRFIGYREGTLVLDVSGELPNTFGQFATVFNDAYSIALDLLYVELVNPYVACCGNPVGFDNVVVAARSAVPEPGTLALAIVPLAFLMLASLGSNRRVGHSG